jgi:hypothetical protein
MFVNVEIKSFYGNLQHVASSVYQGLRIQNIVNIWLRWGNILFELKKYVNKKVRFHILVVGSEIQIHELYNMNVVIMKTNI